MRFYEVFAGHQCLYSPPNQRSASIIRKLSSVSPDDIAICAIVRAELFACSSKSQTPIQSLAKQRKFLNRFVSLPFDDVAYGPMRAKLEKAGTPIGALDMLIAAIAIANDLIPVTHNTTEFNRIVDLKIEDWEV